MRRWGPVIGLAVVALVVAGCGGADSGNPVATGPETTSVSTAAPTTTTESPAEPETPVCVDDSVVQNAVASLPSFKGNTWKVSDQGDPCATLSWVDAKIEGSMAASPETVLFFRDNTYLGTATAEPFSFTTIDSQTDDTVTVSYRWLRDGEATSQLSGGPALIRYQWNGSSVDMLDQMPAELAAREGYDDSSCVSDAVVQDALASLPELFDGGGWRIFRQGDPCATMSWVVAHVYGATGSSPVSVLFFHDNVYLGTATSKAYGFTDVAEASDDTVTVGYMWANPGEGTADRSGGPALIRYHWNGSSVDMLDQLPVEVTG